MPGSVAMTWMAAASRLGHRAVSYRHAGRAHDEVHGAAAPAADGRYGIEPRMKNGPALAGHGAAAMRDAITAKIGGNEFAQHAQLTTDTGLAVYSADPHSPGSAARTKTPTACCASTSPRALISRDRPSTTSRPSPQP